MVAESGFKTARSYAKLAWQIFKTEKACKGQCQGMFIYLYQHIKSVDTYFLYER